ncbi:MAG TPA: response regulator transcription factor [Chitinophagaceae bacterium]|jgi:DNA-binding response OmpR family regulator|nr:response regulator transcription factor [Chitinophagaceae bacterium]
MKLLIIEDEKELAASIASYLKNENYTCEVASNFKQAIDKIETTDYECIALDITLPDGSGMQLLKELKNNKKSEGVIIISAKNSIDDRINGLRLGADDYLVKPFHLSELAARINAIIRRKMYNGNNIIRFNEIFIDTLAKEVTVKKELIELTRKEYELLLYFLSNQRRVISKNALISHLWSQEMGTGESADIIYTHIKNLRKKLSEKGCGDYIRSLYGMGYKLTDQ